MDSQIAVYIDYENLVISCQGILDENEVDWQKILDTAVTFGRSVIRRAYADWSNFSSEQRELLRLGIDLVHVNSKRGKNAADIRIVIDALEMLMGTEHISHVLLVSGDGDFTELVHRLRARGLEVIGLGVSGASAEYLINACDQFIYYDRLIEIKSESNKQGHEDMATATFDVSEARQLLRRAMQAYNGEWVNASQVKGAMLRLNPAFSERNYQYNSFKEFLEAQKDLVSLHEEKPGILTVQMRSDVGNHDHADPDALLDKYLDILADKKIRMTPTKHRPNIILQFYKIYEAKPARSLTAVKEELHTYFEENKPHVKWREVHETIHQLFRTYCFEFDPDNSKYEPGVRLWEKEVTLTSDVTGAYKLLRKCDRGLLQMIAQQLGTADLINREVAARLLYGTDQEKRVLDLVAQLIKEIKKAI